MELVWSIVAVVITILLALAFYFLIKHNIKKLHEDGDVLNDKTVSKTDMKKSIASYIKKVGRFGDFSLIYIDIDNFSATNEVFGKEQCDEFLTEIANRFSKRYPYRTVISKYNNDEFLIFIKENLTYEQVCKVADTLLADVRQKLYVSTSESIVLTASAGICLYPSCGKDVDSLITNLELATYISKREGGNKYTVYYKNLTKDESNNFVFFQEIKKAIANKEFVLYYQPIMDLDHNKVYGFEGLMRWQHPERGVLPPAEFINIMEQSGDIFWVGKWGLELLAKQLSEVQKLNESGEAHMSLNLSTRQLTSEGLADDLILVAKKASIDPKNVILEIAGYTMFEKMENVKPNIMKLRDFGFTIAVDGFELDYSTISRIQKEPIDMIKLNRSFLSDIENNEIKEKFVTMLVESAKVANRLVVAEGVEISAHQEYIKKLGISIGQGYFYSKPMPEEAISEFIRFRKWEQNEVEADKNYQKAKEEAIKAQLEENAKGITNAEGKSISVAADEDTIREREAAAKEPKASTLVEDAIDEELSELENLANDALGENQENNAEDEEDQEEIPAEESNDVESATSPEVNAAPENEPVVEPAAEPEQPAEAPLEENSDLDNLDLNIDDSSDDSNSNDTASEPEQEPEQPAEQPAEAPVEEAKDEVVDAKEMLRRRREAIRAKAAQNGNNEE